MLEATTVLLYALLPLSGVHPLDGLVVPYDIIFGIDAGKDFKDAYMTEKKNRRPDPQKHCGSGPGI